MASVLLQFFAESKGKKNFEYRQTFGTAVNEKISLVFFASLVIFHVYKAQCLPTTWRRNAMNLAMTSSSPYMGINTTDCTIGSAQIRNVTLVFAVL